MSILHLPTIPNSPLDSIDTPTTTGPMQLRRNAQLSFVENGVFDESIAVYDDNYQNSQAHSPQFLAHMTSVLDILKSQFPKGSRLVEVGCGKGDFFEMVLDDGHFDAIGFDATYEGNNPKIEKRYLTNADSMQADIVVLRHVLEHIQRPHEFVKTMANIFGNAAIYIEVPAFDWIEKNQTFFDITYEHVNYFSQAALLKLFDNQSLSNGLIFQDQYQYIIANLNNVSDDFAIAYNNGDWENLSFEGLFPNLIQKIDMIENQLKENGKIYVWGAATKGCMFILHCHLHNRLKDKIASAVDINPGKKDKFLPLSYVPIRAPDAFFKQANDNDLLIISNPNYKDEIYKALCDNGLGKMDFITL